MCRQVRASVLQNFPAAICSMLPRRHKQTCCIHPHQRIFIRRVDSRGEELELQQLCFAQHGADEEALLASWQDTLFAWLERVLFFIATKLYSSEE
jgi:transposase-like protein